MICTFRALAGLHANINNAQGYAHMSNEHTATPDVPGRLCCFACCRQPAESFKQKQTQTCTQRSYGTDVQKRASPWHGDRLPDGQLLLVAALLILEDPFIPSWGSEQGQIVLLVCVVPRGTLWRIVALHQAITCKKGHW